MSIYSSWSIEEPLKGHPYELRCKPETRWPAVYFKDAANAFHLRIPGARLTFNLAPEITELLKEIGRLNIEDSRAQSEWGWKPAYSLEDMVDDVIKEFNENRPWYLS